MRLPLEPCHRYIVAVSLLNETGSSLQPLNWLRVKPLNTAPPANPIESVIGSQVRLSWEHSCHLKDQQPAHYLVKIYDFALNHSATTQVSGLQFDFRMAKGAQYRFEVAAPIANAIPMVWDIIAMPLPIPQEFDVFAVSGKANAFESNWRPVRLYGET